MITEYKKKFGKLFCLRKPVTKLIFFISFKVKNAPKSFCSTKECVKITLGNSSEPLDLIQPFKVFEKLLT